MAPNNPGDPQFVESLLLKLVERVDQISDKMNEKIDSLDAKVSENHRDMRQAIDDKIDAIAKQVHENTKRIERHDYYFNVVTWLITGGLAVLASWSTWLQNLFNNHK